MTGDVFGHPTADASFGSFDEEPAHDRYLLRAKRVLEDAIKYHLQSQTHQVIIARL